MLSVVSHLLWCPWHTYLLKHFFAFLRVKFDPTSWPQKRSTIAFICMEKWISPKQLPIDSSFSINCYCIVKLPCNISPRPLKSAGSSIWFFIAALFGERQIWIDPWAIRDGIGGKSEENKSVRQPLNQLHSNSLPPPLYPFYYHLLIALVQCHFPCIFYLCPV